MARTATLRMTVALSLVMLCGSAMASEEPPAGLSHADWSQIQRSIQESSYRVEPLANGAAELQAPNPQQRYRTTFRREGIEIAAGRPTGTPWRIALTLTGYGYAGDVSPLGDAEPIAVNDRVEYRHGPVTEWYVNRPGGLEQGFTIAEPETRRSGPIVLAMAVDGELEMRIEDGVVASFQDAAGQTRMRYAGLAAWDADGQPLASRLEASPGELRVLVEAGEARFPVTVDPVFVQEAKLEGHGDPGLGEAGAQAGWSVSVSGDTAVIASPDYSMGFGIGAAYVFVRSGTVWQEQQRLVPSGGAVGGEFGLSVSISGDTAVVGAIDPYGGDNAGAYVFVRSGTLWSEQQKLVAPDRPGYWFGWSVSISGDTVVVGARSGDFTGVPPPVYVFERAGTVWNEGQKLVASDGTDLDLFGSSVSISGDTALIGAPEAGTAGGPYAGAAYMFTRSGTLWSEQQKLLASDGANQDQFGYFVSISADTALIGAPEAGTAGGPSAGAAYVFVRSGTVWSEQQKLLASDAAMYDGFGGSVSVSGDTALVGALSDDTAGGVDAGSAYVFVRSGTLWSEQQKLVAADGVASDYFGWSVSASGNTALVGAPHADTAGGVNAAGSAYVFVQSGTVWSEQQKLVTSDGTSDDEIGRSVSVFGDTAVVGAPRDHTVSGVEAGSAYVFARSGTVWSEQQKLVASDGAAYDHFGWEVSISGDTALVGAPENGTTGSDAGSTYVFVRSGTAWTEQQKLVALDGASADHFGAAVSISGDTALVGAPDDDTAGGVDAGSAYVFVRSGTVWTEQQKLVASDGAPADGFGFSVSASGDTALIGAEGDDTAGGATGSAYVFLRSGTVWSEQQKLLASDGAMWDFFGRSVSASGDTALIGAPGDDTASGTATGSAYVFVRSGMAWSEQQKLLASDGTDFDLFGVSVSVVGDMAVVGTPQADTAGGPSAGAAYVFTRSGTLWSEQQKLVASGVEVQLGWSVSISGDTALVGVPFGDTAGGQNSGSTLAFRGLTATDAGVAKTDGQASAVPGTPVSYALTVSDTGPDPGVGVRVVDVPPATLTSVSWTCTASPGSSCPASGSGTIDHTANVDVGGSLTYMLTGTVSASATGSLVNTVTVVPPAGVIDPVPANDSATDTDVLTPEADLALSLSDAPDPVASGGTLTYTLQATNLGPSNSSGLTVTDALPGVLTLVSSSPGCSTAGGTVTCALGGSAPNVSQTVTLQAIVNPGTVGSFGNTASLAGIEIDPVASNDTATELTQVSLRELGHGTALSADLRAAGGILADQDIYRIGQQPYSSYEVVLDATSADIGSGQGPDLERLASDASTVIQSSQAAGAGSSRSLRWENDSAASVLDQYVRVQSAGCTTGCTPEDVYRVRAWDTTLLGPRFNNSGTQVTVLVLQNTSDAPVTGHVQFWNASGALAGTQAVSLAPRASLALNTSTLPGVAGQSGSLTLTHDGSYGTLLGKAVSIESATGFIFDTPFLARGH